MPWRKCIQTTALGCRLWQHLGARGVAGEILQAHLPRQRRACNPACSPLPRRPRGLWSSGLGWALGCSGPKLSCFSFKLKYELSLLERETERRTAKETHRQSQSDIGARRQRDRGGEAGYQAALLLSKSPLHLGRGRCRWIWVLGPTQGW